MRNENVKYVLNNPGERNGGGRERPRMDADFFLFFLSKWCQKDSN